MNYNPNPREHPDQFYIGPNGGNFYRYPELLPPRPELDYDYWLVHNSATQRRLNPGPVVPHPPTPRFIWAIGLVGVALWLLTALIFVGGALGGESVDLKIMPVVTPLFWIGLTALATFVMLFAVFQAHIDPRRYRRTVNGLALGLTVANVAHHALRRREG